jgi:hypothetical protein
MLGDICANSDADVSFDKLTFSITGSDEAVKAALMVISQIKFVSQSQYQIRVKIELANEHKEFVSGKKNGKINKIMGQSNVQIMFDNFGEYNFNIDVLAQNYESMKQGLSLVEQEMPASISFHVPDQYHKRIIGIGGQHIQRIMKKHSVFVKFSNAMDRGKFTITWISSLFFCLQYRVLGGMGREEDDSRVDNVICRTPARNAQNLELVKSEILEMVDRVVSLTPPGNAFFGLTSSPRTRNSLLKSSTSIVSTIVSYWPVSLRLKHSRKSGTARLSSQALSKLVTRLLSRALSGRFLCVLTGSL